MEQGAWSRVHGARGMEQGAWSKGHGAGCMEQGAWSRVHGVKSRGQKDGRPETGDGRPKAIEKSKSVII
jgi:hypothetical protein